QVLARRQPVADREAGPALHRPRPPGSRQRGRDSVGHPRVGAGGLVDEVEHSPGPEHPGEHGELARRPGRPEDVDVDPERDVDAPRRQAEAGHRHLEQHCSGAAGPARQARPRPPHRRRRAVHADDPRLRQRRGEQREGHAGPAADLEHAAGGGRRDEIHRPLLPVAHASPPSSSIGPPPEDAAHPRARPGCRDGRPPVHRGRTPPTLQGDAPMSRITETSDQWWKTAVIYCLDIETFFDSDGDGVGDVAGVVERIDYLAELGVTCLWLMPFYPTPDRDDGYDVTDFYGVDARLGTHGDVVELIRTAKDRGMRVIADLLINHTSDQHPWFKAARRSTDNPFRNHYVWRA